MITDLVLYERAEVVVPEEDAELPLLHSRHHLTQPVIGQLRRRGLQELLCEEA